MLRTPTILATLPAALALCTLFSACDDSHEPEAKVDVPEVAGDVAQEDFCALYDQIQCAASDGCCTSAPYASVEACLAASPCRPIADLLDSPLVAAGTVVYDPAAAGDFLRQAAASAGSCGESPDVYGGLDFLSGTRDEGADCGDSDRAAPLSCKPGLRCLEGGDASMSRPPTCVARAAGSGFKGAGEACVDQDECANGPCEAGVCTVDREALYCAAPPAAPPPSNATVARLSFKVDTRKNSESSASAVNLTYYEYISAGDYKTWSCKVSGPFAAGSTYSCTLGGSSTSHLGWNDYDAIVKLSHSSDDGLRIDRVCTLDANSDEIECHGTFWDLFGDWCGGCSWGFCDWCMLDNDGNGNCNVMKLDFGEGAEGNFQCN